MLRNTPRFGDSPIGIVIPRIPVRHQPICIDASSFLRPVPPGIQYQGPDAAPSFLVGTRKPAQYTKKKRQDPDYSRRREHIRAKQALYRQKQREYPTHLEMEVERLHQEIRDLKRKYRVLSSRQRSNQSPWSIVAEVFHLIEISFRSTWRTVNAREMKAHKETRQVLAVLEQSFAHDAAMGSLCGVSSLIEQLRRFSQYFTDPYLHLMRIESVVSASGVLTAQTKLNVTVSELSLKHIFVDDRYEWREILCKHLLGQRLEFNCTMTFLFDEESRRVVRLENNIDLVSGLLQGLRNLQHASTVLESARITSECIVGVDLTGQEA
ncbi:bZIP transcription factor 1 [Phytophthora citrophthora]|uniref:BZIP transcription factor 1 n=1 Tax=Phytophthora citrophthora TaxID=4793 RepID=A0AAD9G972_9STRA|nr:bZIP transcription factor 1 [Phytophthora citrophthora]